MKHLLASIAALALAVCVLPATAQDVALTVDNAAEVTLLATNGRGRARDVAWASDDTFLVASATNLWRYDSAGAAPTPLFDGQRPVYGVAVNPAGDLMALCDANQLTVYDYPALTERYSVAEAGCETAPEALGFSPDGMTLASAAEKVLRLWDVETGEARGAFAHTTDVLSINFMPHDELVTRARDGLLRWYNAEGEVARTLDVPALPAGISPDGALLATAESGEIDGRTQPYVAITDLDSGEIVQRLATPSTRYGFVAGGQVVTAREGQFSLWDLATGEALATVELPMRQARQVVASPDGRQALIASSTGVAVFDVEARQMTAYLSEHMDRVQQVGFSPDGLRLAANTQSNLRLWELTTQDETLIHAGYPFTSFAFAADGDLFTNGQEATLIRWSAETGEQLDLLEEGESSQVIVFSPDGGTVALSSHRAWGALVWDMEEERERFPLENAGSSMDEVSDIAFSPDGQRIATGTWFGSVSVWNRYGGAEIARLGPYHDGPIEPYVSGLSFSPDSEWLYYSESGVGLIHRWNVRDRAEAEPLHADCDATTMDTVFAPHSGLLATACDRDVLLWDSADGRLLARLSGHTETVMALAFSPDGATLASGSWDGTVRLWGLR